jgi:hypothetical protein
MNEGSATDHNAGKVSNGRWKSKVALLTEKGYAHARPELLAVNESEPENEYVGNERSICQYLELWLR